MPFKGLFYNPGKVGDLGDVATLPYDIISESKRERYYAASEFNYVRIILGKDEPGDNDNKNRYTRAAGYLSKWLSDGVLVEDEKPGFYVYEQEYDVEGVRKRQVGVIALVKLEPFERGIVLPHEQIYEKPMLDRYSLLKETRASLESIIGLYADPQHETSKVLGSVMRGKPRIDLAHDDGVRNRIWPVYDQKTQDFLAGFMRERKVIIADGHHRYTTALKYLSEDGGDRKRAYIMMLLYSMEEDLTIMPTHRALSSVPSYDRAKALKKLNEYFNVKEYPMNPGGELDRMRLMFEGLASRKGKHAFGMYAGGGRFYLMALKDSDMIAELVDNTKSREWNELDVTILHSLVIEYILDVRRDDIERIRYVKDRLKAVELVDSGGCDLAFFLNPTKLSQVKVIAEAGEKMPQKSSYFYPKPLSGLVAFRFQNI